jgi:hypothetical protein
VRRDAVGIERGERRHDTGGAQVGESFDPCQGQYLRDVPLSLVDVLGVPAGQPQGLDEIIDVFADRPSPVRDDPLRLGIESSPL